MMAVALAHDVTPLVTMGVLEFVGAAVVEIDHRIAARLAETLEHLRHTPPAEARVAAVRRMYRGFGIDPTKTRPSSEALARRVRRGDPFPRVNSLVDLCNWCSVESALPFGLYDADRIQGAIELRRGRDGEVYPGIRKDIVHLVGRPTLVDAEGPFGNPTSDSARTMVTDKTTHPLFVVFAPRLEAQGWLEDAMSLTSTRVVTFTGAAETGRLVL